MNSPGFSCPRLAAVGLLLLCPCLLLAPTEASAQAEEPPSGFQPSNGRLLTTEAAAVLSHPVIGLQRSALPITGGVVLDTSLYSDLLLAPNLGLRWAMAAGPHRFVAGARYTHFMGAPVYSSVVEGQEPAVKRFEPTLTGPTVYGAYGLELGPLLVQGEARYARFEEDYLSVTGAAALNLIGRWAIIGEVGVRLAGGSALRAAAGVRYGGENFGLALGAAYVDISDPVLGELPVLPVLDLSWTFR